ncbi:unnamed protein product, partial [Didymodactylos carnosus]
SYSDKFPLYLNRSDLGTYSFDSFHLHWGQNPKQGSEHYLNGNKYAGEAHFVHTNNLKSHSIVLGFFINAANISTVTTQPPQQQLWYEYTEQAVKLQNVNDTVGISTTLLTLMNENLTEYWQYDGSLTTPPCSESVTFVLFKKPIDFSFEELKELHDVIYKQDFREPQPRNKRRVWRSYDPNGEDDSVPPVRGDDLCCSEQPSSNGASRWAATEPNNDDFYISYTLFTAIVLCTDSLMFRWPSSPNNFDNARCAMAESKRQLHYGAQSRETGYENCHSNRTLFLYTPSDRIIRTVGDRSLCLKIVRESIVNDVFFNVHAVEYNSTNIAKFVYNSTSHLMKWINPAMNRHWCLQGAVVGVLHATERCDPIDARSWEREMHVHEITYDELKEQTMRHMDIKLKEMIRLMADLKYFASVELA